MRERVAASGRRRAWLRLLVAVLVATVLQTALGADVRVLGVAPDLLLLLAICAGLAAGAEVGCLVGFVAGLAVDIFLTATPFGLSALAYCLVGFGVGVLRTNLLRDSWLLAPAVAFVGTIVGVGLFVGIGDVVSTTGPSAVGHSWIVRVALIEGVWGAAMAIVVHPVVSRLARGLATGDVSEPRPDPATATR